MGPSPGARSGWLKMNIINFIFNGMIERMLRIDVQHCGKGKRYRFSRSSLSNGDNISTTEGHRPCLALNRSGGGESLGADGGHQVFGEPNLVKGCDRPRNVTALNLE